MAATIQVLKLMDEDSSLHGDTQNEQSSGPASYVQTCIHAQLPARKLTL